VNAMGWRPPVTDGSPAPGNNDPRRRFSTQTEEDRPCPKRCNTRSNENASTTQVEPTAATNARHKSIGRAAFCSHAEDPAEGTQDACQERRCAAPNGSLARHHRPWPSRALLKV
jgi:hypothetical protein